MATRINIDGVLLEPDQAQIPVFDRGFLYGDSVYEVVRTYRGVPFALDRHLERLGRSAAKLALDLPDQVWLEDQIGQTMAAADNPDSYIRIIVTRGSGPLTLDPTAATTPRTVILVQAFEPFPAWMYARGIRVTIPQVRRQARAAGETTAKTGNYLNSVLALGEAKRRGYDDALLLDTHGRVAEATSANVFIARNDALCTPAQEAGPLMGVTRGLILEIARAEGIEVSECELTPDDLIAADELMLTSTLREVLPVVSVDERAIGQGRPGPVAKRLLALFRQRALEMID